MVSKKKCSSYASELSTKHTTRAAVGLNACRWERRTEDTPDYDVIDPNPATPPRAPPKAKKLSAAGQKRVAKSKEMEFVQAPRKVQPKAKPKPKSKPLPANLREGLTVQQRKRLQSYTGQRGKRLMLWICRINFSSSPSSSVSGTAGYPNSFFASIKRL